MGLFSTLERGLPAQWTARRLLLGGQRSTWSSPAFPLSPPSISSSSAIVSSSVTASKHVLVERAPLRDFVNIVASVPIHPRLSIEAVFQGTRVRVQEMRLKMQHLFPRPHAIEKAADSLGFIGLTAATNLNHQHCLTLESTLRSAEDRQSLSSFVSSKFGSRLSWGLAVSRKVHQTLTFFSRFNSEDSVRNRFIIQVVHNANEKASLSPIISLSTGCHPQAGISLTSCLTETRSLGPFSFQMKGFCSGSGAFSVSMNARAGEVN